MRRSAQSTHRIRRRHGRRYAVYPGPVTGLNQKLVAPKRSRWRGATFATVRSVFVKIAVRIEELKRSIKLAFPRHLPHADALALITARRTAQGP